MKSLNGMRVLLTGATGFIGREIASELRILDCEPTVVGRRAKGAGAVTADLTKPGDWQATLRKINFDFVLHFAGSARGMSAPELEMAHVSATRLLLESLSGSRARILLASSGAVYGAQDPHSFPIEEARAPAPVDSYGQSKLEQEIIATAKAMDMGLPEPCIVRMANVVGPGQSDRFFLGRLVNLAMEDDDGPLQLGNLATTRDFIDVRDVTSAILALMVSCGVGIFNVGSGRETSLRNVVDLVLRETNCKREIVTDNTVFASPVRRQCLDIKKLVTRTDWLPVRTIEDTIISMVEHRGAAPPLD